MSNEKEELLILNITRNFSTHLEMLPQLVSVLSSDVALASPESKIMGLGGSPGFLSPR
jgi:hypothetical protein